MRLKSLELHGFKSFPDRTKINFSEGMTVIVGPNGSGKSNISDAIRWVLGDLSAKNIRGNKMEDVIFGGTNGRSPMSFAEVSLTIENTGENRIENDFDEITVTRRYYRSGDSEYLINNKISRLRDITEMFMNTGIGKTGYSIVGQGRVSEIISQKSEERRLIFEEAAGISKYRFKKQEAERRLADTDENLVRITDIVSELDGRIGPLEKDAAKARIYLDLYEKKKEADIAVSVFDIEKINTTSQQIENDYQNSERELEIVDEAISSYDTRIERLGELLTENKLSYNMSIKESGEITEEKHRLESELLVMQNDINHLDVLNTDIKSNFEQLKTTIANKKVEIASAENEKQNLKKNVEDSEDSYRQISEILEKERVEAVNLHRKIDETSEKIASVMSRHTDARIELSAIEETQSSLSSKKSDIQNEIADMEKSIELTDKKIDSINKTLEQYKSKLTEIEHSKNDFTEKSNERQNKLKNLREKYTSLLAEISAMDQRAITLKRMEEHFEGYSRSVKFIADAADSGKISGIYGPVSQIIQVDRKYSIAIETSLGSNIQNIVVENESTAKTAISLLKREGAGRSTFYPLTSMKPAYINLPDYVTKSAGYIGIASELCTYERKFYPVISNLLGRTLIFDSLDHASDVAKKSGYSLRIVTLDGQIINAGGSFTGGSAKRDSGILTRSIEIEEIIAAKKINEEKAEQVKSEIDKHSVDTKENTEEMNRLNDEFALFSALYRSEQTALSFQNNRLSELSERRTVCENSLTQLFAKEDEKADKRKNLLIDCEKMKTSENILRENLEVFNKELTSLDRKINELVSEKNDSFTAMTLCRKEFELSQKNHEKLTGELCDLENDYESVTQKLKSNSERRKLLIDNISNCRNSMESLSKRLDFALKGERELSDKSIELEKEINDLRQTMREKTRERETLFIRYTTLKTKVESVSAEKSKLTDRLWEDYELTFADAAKMNFEPVTDETRQKRVAEQSKLRSKIRELGNVNVDAIEEYSKVRERFEFLSSQLNDLNKSKKEFTDIITKLETEMCQKFSETFEKINENFKQVFSELFGGGTGSLSLSDPENVLTSGIEINVAPPGKIIKNLKLLSGGEQVFVAIGIFFAILKVNPSPFCLLDEIESALDEVNVDRFAEYAKHYSGNTQFIIITHRRGTMEEADSLYGVTMQERGISKILSISVNEVEQKLGVKL